MIGGKEAIMNYTAKQSVPKYDLEDRLLQYAASIVKLVERIPNTRTGNHVGGQLLRSGTSPLFNHGEAQAAESPNDFVHKMRICLKELRESQRALRLIKIASLLDGSEDLQEILSETDELIRIFVASIQTASQKCVREGDGDESSVSCRR
jgi:four helix bundle protein